MEEQREIIENETIEISISNTEVRHNTMEDPIATNEVNEINENIIVIVESGVNDSGKQSRNEP
eukprot:11490200-Heterocapsa_arctica.AAC.1